MTSPIFLDTNVFLYVLGREHTLKMPSKQVLDLAATCDDFFTNAEVTQEVLHRYTSQGRWREMKPYVDLVFNLMELRVADMTVVDTQYAGSLALSYPKLEARDLIHIAIMHRVGAKHIVTADRDFDRIEGITRLDPLRVDEWQSLVSGN